MSRHSQFFTYLNTRSISCLGSRRFKRRKENSSLGRVERRGPLMSRQKKQGYQNENVLIVDLFRISHVGNASRTT